MLILKIRLLFLLAFTAVLIFCVSGDDSLQLIQKKCKAQNDAFHEKEMKGEDNCVEYKKLVHCIAKVNFTAVNAFVSDHKPENCEFSDKDIKELQKYNVLSTQEISTTTQINNAAGPMMMKALLVITLILQALCF